ncbi:hypothetical protein BJX68DRAFT_267595 [Aspergillus pseudodeflectus]|uniref:Ankyrin repeat-containing domain protein n=1 Tax=Aspergillus pseudodeflectus TaxID=176178 RepID=A0ABR4K8X3_9EURO
MGNTDVVKELARPEYNLGINVQDARGWSPLHVAAYAGAYPTLCTLLALGADAELKSWQVSPGVDWRVTAKDVAAVDLARLRGEKQHRVFLQALQAVKGAGPEDAEMFWDAVETI